MSPTDLPELAELQIPRLGPAAEPSTYKDRRKRFVDESNRVLLTSETRELEPYLAAGKAPPSFEAAGPREEIFFSPGDVSAGIVTCGGLCPGLNDVIRSIVLTLRHGYGVDRVLGFRYGYSGLSAHPLREPLFLEPDMLEHAHLHGGTLLGTSRGPQDVGEMVDNLVRWKIRILFTVGGDGTLRGAAALAEEIDRRGLAISVVGVPKTIDNDLLWIERSFGFATAVEAARTAINAAHTEADAAWNGIGLVKLMGRHSGFIAAYATLASGDVNYCLVPEVPFTLDGEGGLLEVLEERIRSRRHAAVVVAEGAGQELVRDGGPVEHDASGNRKLKDVGRFLKRRFLEHFERRDIPIDLKYIDPSYMIRSQPANTLDSGFCLILGQHAVHAGMAGRTGLAIGFWNHSFTHVPLSLVGAGRRRMDPEDEIWQRVLDATGQPVSIVGGRPGRKMVEPDSQPRGPRPVVLIVRDGWGRNPHPEHDEFNAIRLAATPRCDELLERYPWTLIHTSGENVGLPDGTMGNSEVGHQNLGAGRIVHQDSVRITRAIRDGSFFDNEVLAAAVGEARERASAVHLMGLASDAGVHALLAHLYACVELCRRLEQQRVFLHLFTDGRDSGPFAGIEFARQVEERCAEIGVGRIATICGRYWSMDRDNRWERVRRAYEALTGRGEPAPSFDSAAAAIQDYYDQPVNDSQEGDEFVTPRTVGAAAESRIRDGDAVIFYNYRGDRPREITRAFVLNDFQGHVAPSPETGERGFDRGPKLDITYVTMTAYEEKLNQHLRVAFAKPPKLEQIAGAFLSSLGLTQFRCAETEKFPHVTFFFNDYREEPFPGESRRMPQSPKVATYDLAPEMSARESCDAVLERVAADDCEDFILVNFANTDMVGHTGKLEAAIRAAETVDGCVGEIVDAVLARGGKLVVTADHGNAEQMWDPDSNAPHTAHTTYDVECIVVDPEREDLASGSPKKPSPALRPGGRLADVFPTVLDLLRLSRPEAMSGRSLLEPEPD